ncbi:hypothetical protein [Aureispira sp. CCB-E]|uniref:hypothetical protein n=1 Tax=Aureispira sp. CCB-E TaxID=3051121 RepID=UPI002868586A|nr:hypothetical protein [Aureispira sp. CCB-E]WMX16578.1 hypothetical protein QP953_09380 [Aureispira sp. CCB-E]
MSVSKYIILQRGNKITYQEKTLKIVDPVSVKVREVKSTKVVGIKGQAATQAQPIDKLAVLAIIHKEIEVLMDVEKELNSKGMTEDELLFGEIIGNGSSVLNSEIRSLKAILSKIEKL